jgi:hypothetical protein
MVKQMIKSERKGSIKILKVWGYHKRYIQLPYDNDDPRNNVEHWHATMISTLQK